MKKKLIKSFGVLLTAVLLVTLAIGLAAPASAGTLAWSQETTPSAVGKQIQATSIVDFAVASDDATVYAVDAIGLFKSLNGGTTWAAAAATGAVGFDLVAVAPDDPNIVVVADTATFLCYASVNGGATFGGLLMPATAFTGLNDITISPAVGTTHYVAAAGKDAGGPQIATFNLGATVPAWTLIDAIGAGCDGTVAANAVAFSPNFASDMILTAVTELGTTDVLFEIFSFAGLNWNDSAGFADYTGVLNKIATGTAIAPIQSATIDLLPTYLGSDPLSRKGFVGLALNAAETTAVKVVGGIYRMSDEADTRISGAVGIKSLAYKTGDLLIAGAFASNVVYYSATPMAAAPVVGGTTLYQRPGGNGPTVVDWAGANAVAATSGAVGAFAVSKDNGATFNDVSFVDNALTVIEDIAVSTDGSRIYMLTNDATDISVWRYNGAWERVLYLAGVTNYDIIRVAPENADAVYVADQGATTMYYSPDGGEKTWMLRACNIAVQDLAVESASVVYALNAAAGTVSKTVNAGFIWGAAKTTYLGNGATINSLGENLLVVGGNAGGVAYSTNGGTSFVPIPAVIGAGNVQVTATGLEAGNAIFAASDVAASTIFGWWIGSNTATTGWTAISAATGAGVGFYDLELSNGVLYAVACDPDPDAAAGTDDAVTTLYRTLNPATAPSFKIVAAPATTANLSISKAPSALRISSVDGSTKLWGINVLAAAAAPTDEIFSFSETVSAVGPTPVGPAEGFVVPMNSVTGQAYDATFTWNRLSTATSYDFQLATSSDFKELVYQVVAFAAGTMNPVIGILGPNNAAFPVGTAQAVFTYMPNTTYYWRVRAVAPVSSPYSAAQSFSIAPEVEPVPEPPAPTPVPPSLEMTLAAPMAGTTGTLLTPTFVWQTVDDATMYELQIATDATFADKIINKSGRTGLKDTNAYVSEKELEYSTNYYWRMRVLVVRDFGPWIYSTFTTKDAPTPPAPPAPTPTLTVVPPAQPAQITPAYIWAIIGIGGALVIAVIILIVRTRRAV